MNTQKKMYKVLVPLDKKTGGTYWMRLGSAFTNRDDSINLYLDAVPPPDPKSNRYHLQIRELTEEDLRRRDAYSAGSSVGSSGAGRYGGGSVGGDGLSDGAAGEPPSSYARELGATTRAVTTRDATEQDVPF